MAGTAVGWAQKATASFLKTAYLIRHPQSHLSPGVCYQDWPLSEQGRLQANKNFFLFLLCL